MLHCHPLDPSKRFHPRRAEAQGDLCGLRLYRDQGNGQEHKQDAHGLEADDPLAQHEH
jgi:hypothetical protein